MAFINKLLRNVSVLYATFFFLGFFSLVSQTMIIREFLVVVCGNEIILGILFFNWLVGIFAGALCGGPAADRGKHPKLLFVISILLMCLLLPLCITCIRLLYAISGTAAGTYIDFAKVFLFSGVFIIPLAFFIGFSFPLAAVVQSETKTGRIEKVRKISAIYICEAAGFFCGGIVYTFCLAGRFNSYFIAGSALLPLLFFSLVLLRRSRYYKTLSLTVILLILSSLILVPTVSKRIDHFTAAGRWRSVSSAPLLYAIESKYQHITAAKLSDQYILYLNNMYSDVFPEKDENMILAAHLFCQHPAPKRILIIGDALSGLAKFLSAYDVEKIVSVEIDPRVVETVLKFLPEEDKKVIRDQRFHIEIMDGRKYVKELAGQPPAFDIVFLNVPEPATLLLNRYYTKDFFIDLSKILPENGILALKITSSETYGKGLVSDYTASIYHTVAAVFPEIVVSPGTQNFIFASRNKASLADDPAILAQRYEKSGVKPQKLAKIFYSLYPEDRTGFIKDVLKNSRKVRINRDGHPSANFYYSKITGWYSGGSLAGILSFFEKLKLRFFLFILLILFVIRASYTYRKYKKSPHCDRGRQFPVSHTLLAVFCSGMAGLSLELVILYTFQNVFGYIYHITGFIIALFMSGLPAGAYLANLLIKGERFSRKGGIIKLMVALQISLSVLSLFVSQVGKLFNGALINEILIFSTTILIGFATGMMFPLALHVCLSRQTKTGAAAGIVNAFDHFGAAAGALFIGAIFLPLLGVFNVCLLTAFFLLCSSMLLAVDLFVLRSHDKVR
jgi:spermidine synthase